MQTDNKPFKVLAVSDSHNNKYALERIVRKEADSDAILFLGDGIEDFESGMSKIKTDGFAVVGNCDADSISWTRTDIKTFAEKRFFMAHGHMFDVKNTYSVILEKAKAEHADVCLFGHTHRQDLRVVDGVLVINPGAVNPAQHYAVVEILGTEIRAELRILKNGEN